MGPDPIMLIRILRMWWRLFNLVIYDQKCILIIIFGVQGFWTGSWLGYRMVQALFWFCDCI